MNPLGLTHSIWHKHQADLLCISRCSWQYFYMETKLLTWEQKFRIKVSSAVWLHTKSDCKFKRPEIWKL